MGDKVHGNDWKLVAVTELRRFIGLLLLIGFHKTIGELWYMQHRRQIFHDIISYNRYTSILHFTRLHSVAYRCKRPNNKLKTRTVCSEIWNNYLQVPCIPNWSITVNEQLVTYCGKCPFRQIADVCENKYGRKWMPKENYYSKKSILFVLSLRNRKVTPKGL